MSSFSENKAIGFLTDSAKAAKFVDRNKFQLARTYPAGFRINSSNYNPQLMWNTGCQLVALNYQTHDIPMALNQGKFRDNGNCGYILKPQFMRNPAMHFNPNDPLACDGTGAEEQVLTIRIISAQNLPKPELAMIDKGEIVDPYVTVEIFGIPLDCAKARTRTIINNGFLPIWNETLEFEVRVPELAMVCIQVWDEDQLTVDDFLAQFVIPFTSIQEGYTHFRLRNSADSQLPNSTIFVHTRISRQGRSRSRLSMSNKAYKRASSAIPTTIDDGPKFSSESLPAEELQVAFEQAPVENVFKSRDDMLKALEDFIESLSLPFGTSLAQAYLALKEQLAFEGMRPQLVTAMVSDVPTYRVTVAEGAHLSTKLTNIISDLNLLCSAMETIIRNNLRYELEINYAVSRLQSSMTGESFSRICAAYRIKKSGSVRLLRAVEERVAWLRFAAKLSYNTRNRVINFETEIGEHFCADAVAESIPAMRSQSFAVPAAMFGRQEQQPTRAHSVASASADHYKRARTKRVCRRRWPAGD
eukprot:m.547550 g.547550  ORF g.547550 m.547550 type:complete len:529 (-) comp57702_c0_seq1:31-1617(-)